MQKLRRFLYVLAYGSLRGVLFSVLCWMVVMSVLWGGNAFITSLPHLGVFLGMVIPALLYGAFIGFMLSIVLSLWTGAITGLVAATMTALFTFPLKNPVLYKRLMQIVCTVLVTVGIFLLAPSEYGIGYQIMALSIAAIVALLLSRHLASWSISIGNQ